MIGGLIASLRALRNIQKLFYNCHDPSIREVGLLSIRPSLDETDAKVIWASHKE